MRPLVRREVDDGARRLGFGFGILGWHQPERVEEKVDHAIHVGSHRLRCHETCATLQGEWFVSLISLIDGSHEVLGEHDSSSRQILRPKRITDR